LSFSVDTAAKTAVTAGAVMVGAAVGAGRMNYKQT